MALGVVLGFGTDGAVDIEVDAVGREVEAESLGSGGHLGDLDLLGAGDATGELLDVGIVRPRLGGL